MRDGRRQLHLRAVLVALTLTGTYAFAQEVTPRAPTGQLPLVGDKEIFQPGTQPCTLPDVSPSCFHTAHTDEFDRKFHPAQSDLVITHSGELPVATNGTEPPRLELTCSGCHGGYASYAPFDTWRGTMMAQAWRDPLARAAIAVANRGLTQSKVNFTNGMYDDGPGGQTGRTAGDYCIRCHTPIGWLEGNSIPADGSRIHGKQMDGVQCDFCHRAVDPLTHEYDRPRTYNFVAGLPNSLLAPDVARGQRVAVLQNGNFVVNDTGFKIGPYLDPVDLDQHPLDATKSTAANPLNPAFTTAAEENAAFLRSSEFCAQCHNVTNPILRVPAGFPGAGKNAPVERTYTEWYYSSYGPAGQNKPCQSCHMASVSGGGYAADPNLADPGVIPLRDPLRQHTFVGGNAWAQDMIPYFFPDQLPLQSIFDDVQEKAKKMLGDAAEVSAALSSAPGGGKTLRVEVLNKTGHKLPTGYPEGRRMWLHVVGKDEGGTVVFESGAYHDADATLEDDHQLDNHQLKVWRAKLGIKKPDEEAYESSHFILNNVILNDNRIAPSGFDPVAAAEDVTVIVRQDPRDCAHYDSLPSSACTAFDFDGDGKSDGVDVVFYTLRAEVTTAEVTLRYQTASKEYVDFLSNPANTGDYTDRFTLGLKAAWMLTGMSPPVDMSPTVVATLTP